MKFKILEEKIEGKELKITAMVKLKSLASDPKIRIKTKDIKENISDRYKILSIIKEAEICNFSENVKKQVDTWIFEIEKIEEKKKAPARKASTRGKTTTKTSPAKNTKSFSQRISDIAKKEK